MIRKKFLLNITFCFLLLIVNCLLLAENVWAVGIMVKPKNVNLKAVIGKEVITEILVANVSEEPALFQVYSEAFTKEITLAPKDFRLEANANQIIKITVLAKEAGRLATNIAVLARPLNITGFLATPGVKVPLNIEVSVNFWFYFKFIILAVLAICLFGLVVVKLKIGREKRV